MPPGGIVAVPTAGIGLTGVPPVAITSRLATEVPRPPAGTGVFHFCTHLSNASAIDSNSSMAYCACGSPSMAIFCALRTSMVTETGTLMNCEIGTGMCGIGGATGTASAAYAGNSGMPASLIVEVYVSHAVPITCAITLEYFSSEGLALGALAMIN